MSITSRLVIVLSVLIALAGTHWRAYTQGQKHERNSFAAAQLQAARDNASAQIKHADNIIEAQNVRTKTEARIASNRLASAGELDRLRDELRTAREDATSQNACATATDSRDKLLGSMARDIENLAKQGEEIASSADGHVADVIMLRSSCINSQVSVQAR